ncbi:tryptophan synthase subunit alpha [Arthrospira platensis SPKY1]|nr:tryptophan synthase subunit alpha [Arthrospira platensis SPKY1]
MLYCVSRKGVTGQQGSSAQPLEEYLTRVRTHTSLPLGVGFGIQSAEEIRALPQQADIAIVGSGLLRAYQSGGLDRLRELLRSLQNA